MKRPVLNFFGHVTELLLLWEISPLVFPLGSRLREARERRLPELRRLLQLAADVGQVARRYDEHTILEHLHYPDHNDRESVDLWLLLFSDKVELVRETRDLGLFRPQYDDREAFIRETAPIFRRMLKDFFSFTLLATAEAYDEEPGLVLHPPGEALEEMLRIVHGLAPPGAGLPPPAELLQALTAEWVTERLGSGPQCEAVCRVIEELRRR